VPNTRHSNYSNLMERASSRTTPARPAPQNPAISKPPPTRTAGRLHGLSRAVRSELLCCIPGALPEALIGSLPVTMLHSPLILPGRSHRSPVVEAKACPLNAGEISAAKNHPHKLQRLQLLFLLLLGTQCLNFLSQKLYLRSTSHCQTPLFYKIEYHKYARAFLSAISTIHTLQDSL